MIVIGPRGRGGPAALAGSRPGPLLLPPAEVVAGREAARKPAKGKGRGRPAARPKAGGRYTKDSYRMAIARACDRGLSPPDAGQGPPEADRRRTGGAARLAEVPPLAPPPASPYQGDGDPADLRHRGGPDHPRAQQARYDDDLRRAQPDAGPSNHGGGRLNFMSSLHNRVKSNATIRVGRREIQYSLRGMPQELATRGEPARSTTGSPTPRPGDSSPRSIGVPWLLPWSRQRW